ERRSTISNSSPARAGASKSAALHRRAVFFATVTQLTMASGESTHGLPGERPIVAADETMCAQAPDLTPTEICPDLARAFQATRYCPRKLHAHGGLGEVYVADDIELGRAVALKRIRDGRGVHAEDEVRFRREAEITGRLEHPGVVPIYGLGS